MHTGLDKCMHFYPYSMGEGNVVSISNFVKIDYFLLKLFIKGGDLSKSITFKELFSLLPRRLRTNESH